MINTITQDNYDYLPLNPLLSYAICAASALKISFIFSKRIHLLNLDQQQTRQAKKALFIALQLSALVSSTFFPTPSAILSVATCTASIALSRNLLKPTASCKPPLSFTEGCFLSKPHLPQDIISKIISHIGENEDPVSRFKTLANLAQSNRMFYMAVQKERAKSINEHLEIPTLEFFDSFASLVDFAKTHDIHQLSFNDETFSDRDIDALTNECPYLSYLDLNSCKIDSTGLQKLALLEDLTHLNLNNSGIDDASLKIIVFQLPKLTHLDISRCSLLTPEGIKTLKVLENLTHLNMTSCKCVDDSSLQTIIPHLTKLTHLNMSYSHLTSEGIKTLKVLKSLIHLNISYCAVDDSSLQTIIPHLTKLTHLNMSYSHLTSEGIKALKVLKNLTHLNISYCAVDDSCLQAIIPHLTKLTHLDISSNRTITSEGIKTIKVLENLTHLEMASCKGVDDSSLQVLAMHLKKIAHLNINDCTNVSSAGMSALSLLENLTSLSIASCQGINDSILEIITQNLKKLENLHMVRCQNLSSIGIKHLKALENLKSLNICNCSGLDDSALQVISTHLKKLTQLRIDSCDVSTNGIRALASLTNLINLSISNCNGVDDSSLQALAQHLKKLRYLNIMGSKNISPIGIKSLIALKNLADLYMNECDGVNNSSLQTLAQHLKKLKILDTYKCKNITWIGKKYISTFYRKIQHRY